MTETAIKPPTTDSWRGIRLKMAAKVPEAVLNKYHRGFLAHAAARESTVREDLIADGILRMVEWDNEWDESVGPSEFMGRAAGNLRRLYQKWFRRLRGEYYNRGGEVVVKRGVVSSSFEYEDAGVPDGGLAAVDLDDVLEILDPGERAVVERVVLGEETVTGVAAESGENRSTVSRRLSAALGKLKGELA